MDLTGSLASVGTQTPTEDCTFEFPECFSSSPPLSRSSFSSTGTQTELRRRVSFEESPIGSPKLSRHGLFRRHSTGSDLYCYSSSPTLSAAFGGRQVDRRLNKVEASQENDLDSSTETAQGKNVGQQLRQIGDNFDRGTFRTRTMSVSRFLGGRGNSRQRTFSSSS